MNKITITVETSEEAMVTDYEAQACNLRRYINRTLVDGVWMKNAEPSEVFPSVEINKHLACGDLLIAVRKKQITKE